MFDVDFGKQITKLGFIGYFALKLLGFILSYVFGRYSAFVSILTFLSHLCLLAAAGGFGIMWLADRETIDLLSAGAVGVAAVLCLIQTLCYFLMVRTSVSSSFGYHIINFFTGAYYPRNWLSSILLSILCSGFYAVLAVRIFGENRMIGLLLICAFLYAMFGGTIYSFVVNRILYRIGLQSDRFFYFILQL